MKYLRFERNVNGIRSVIWLRRKSGIALGFQALAAAVSLGPAWEWDGVEYQEFAPK